MINGTLTVGDLIAVTMYLPSLYTPLQRFSELSVVFANSMAAVDRVFEIMDQKPEIRDQPGAIDLENVEGRVEFEHVCFAYHNDEDEPGPVLRDMNFVVEPGEKVALVGPSGSGKSTVVSLIPRFYDIDEGRVLIDGCDVRDGDAAIAAACRRHGAANADPVQRLDLRQYSLRQAGSQRSRNHRSLQSRQRMGFHPALPEGHVQRSRRGRRLISPAGSASA